MTIDKAKLKALAEAQAVQVWVRTRGRRPDMKDQPLMYGVEGPEGVSDYEDWGFTGKAADYIATASPATMLALLAEIEHLQDLVAEWRRSSPVMPSRACAAIIDQLKAENDQLKNHEIELKAENEALRKDAERYRWLRKPRQEQRQVKTWTSLEVMDENIDAAMAKEASHD